MAMGPIDRILETVLYVDDLGAAELFYSEVLGLELDSRKAGLFCFFRVGDGMLLLFEPEASQANTAIPAHGTHGAGHACFAVPEQELEAWKRKLEGSGDRD